MPKSPRRRSNRSNAASPKLRKEVPMFRQPSGDPFTVTAAAVGGSYLVAITEAEKRCQEMADVICTATGEGQKATFQKIVDVAAKETRSVTVEVAVTAAFTCLKADATQPASESTGQKGDVAPVDSPQIAIPPGEAASSVQISRRSGG